ncbi:hypothetical protein BDW72DRAFT_208976 [Aspergillus terricola var. indicus]
MQAANRLQKALKAGAPAFGAWQMLPGTNLTRTICRSAPNIDWLLVDLEHGNVSDDGMHEIIAAAAACGASPIVRVAEGQHWMIKRTLDAGAHGIMVPMIETVDDARRVVEYSKFPPRGKRGFEPLLVVDKFVSTGANGKIRQLAGVEYLQQADEGCALENVDAIAAIDGIDVLFIGPLISGLRSRAVDAILRVYRTGRRNGKAVGVYCDTGEQGKTVVTDMVGLKKVVRGEFEVAGGVQ